MEAVVVAPEGAQLIKAGLSFFTPDLLPQGNFMLLNGNCSLNGARFII